MTLAPPLVGCGLDGLANAVMPSDGDLGLSWWVVVGTLLQFTGALVTAYGLARTWREFAEEGFFDEPKRRLRAAWAVARVQARAIGDRLLRRHRRVAGAGVAIGGAGSLTVRGRIGWAPLPTTSKAAIKELDRRIGQLLDRLSDTQERVQEIGAEITRLGGTIRTEVERLERRDRRVAVGGLRVAVSGLMLVAFGLFIQAIGLVVD